MNLPSASATTMVPTLTIGILGTRGIPNRYGGFERFVELLVNEPIWAENGIRFVVYGESESRPYNAWTRLHKVSVVKDQRPLAYYVASAVPATRECDILLCCSIGLSFFAFWPLLFGKPLIVNPDGCEWRRTKWSRLGRFLIHAMYPPSLLAARRIVIDAEALREDFGWMLGSKAHYIAYQAPEPGAVELSTATRQRLALDRPFMLVIARLEPENNLLAIVQAFRSLPQGAVDLVVVGGTTTPHYRQALAPLAAPHVRFVGGIYEQDVLNELRSNCIAYLHGHSVGGTNPSLLEALASVRGRLICHDNKYNREVAGEEARYFADKAQLAATLKAVVQDAGTGSVPTERTPSRGDRFRPDVIAGEYLNLFLSLAPKVRR